MLSPKFQRVSYRSIAAVTVIVLLTLHYLVELRVFPNGASGQTNYHAATTKFDMSSSRTANNEQDILDDSNDITSDSAISVVDDAAPTALTSATPEENAPTSTILTMSAVEDTSITLAALNEPKRAFVTYLEVYTGEDRSEKMKGSEQDDDDEYFVATRVLGYQLMHQPDIRSNTSIPFVVVVSRMVAESKRVRLERDGAKVVVVDLVRDPDWVENLWLEQGQDYRGHLTKLRVFQQTDYEKMLYMDADMLITRRLDAIFEDEGTEIQQPKLDNDTKKESAPLPSSFILAAQAQQTERSHSYPPDHLINLDWFCSGFMVAKPSLEIFDYYVSVMERNNSFDPRYPDQNLLNYAHRRDGPMPWTNVYYKWTTSYPTIKEYAMGAASLHDKYWQDRGEAEGLSILKDKWLSVKSDMEAYYRERDG